MRLKRLVNHRKFTILLFLIIFSVPGLVASNQVSSSSEAYMEIIMNVHDETRPDFGQGCIACHERIYQERFVLLKYKVEETIQVEVEKNHHRLHRLWIDYGDNCTVCHDDLQGIRVEGGGVSVSSFVDKFECAGCHSTFAPLDIMERSYYEDGGCPGCHGAAWIDAHEASIPFNNQVPFIKENSINEDQTDCLTCHGDNPYIVPSHIQDDYWEGRSFPQ